MRFNLGGLSLDVNTLMWAITAQTAPGLAKGAILKLVADKSAQQVLDMVREWQNGDVWQTIPEEWQENIVLAEEKTGILAKITTQWLANSLRKDKPALASLLMNSKEMQKGIRKAVRDIRRGTESFRRQRGQ